ncbi:MAG: bifunctional 3'-5' exonuclease/DNA polymerase, partial [Clostridia bacterium]|nr:bifunctional 3'-5' exonuclease/DNA polymerase [Clostridia bacterium]
IDTETTGLDPFNDRLRLIQIASFGNPVYIIDYWKCTSQDKAVLKQLLLTSSVKVFQNAKFDINFLKSEGLALDGPIFDTMLAARLLRTPKGPSGYSLAAISEFFLGETLPKEEQTSDFSGELRTEQLKYAARDASILLELRSVMVPALKANNLVEIAGIEFNCTKAIADIEYRGISIDMQKWADLTQKTKNILVEAEKNLMTYAGNTMIQPDFFGNETAVGINLNSNQDILDLLEKNGVNVPDTSKYSLSPYKERPVVKSLHEYRKASKLVSGFLDPLPDFINKKTGRIHAHYSQIGAYSGRMSCTSPNMQQIPRDDEIRQCFVPADGFKFIVADYSQIELRVAAQLAGDERMIEAYKNGGDLHRLTASLVTGTPIREVTKEQRQAAKAVNFGLIFAMGARGLQSYAGDVYGVEMSLEEAEAFRDRYFNAYKGIKNWHDSVKANPPRVSRSLSGRRYFHNEDAGIAALYNTPVQGTAADIVKNALGMLMDTLKSTSAGIVAVVHDEILLEAPESEAEETALILKNTMESAGNDFMPDVPLVAEAHLASSWAEK